MKKIVELIRKIFKKEPKIVEEKIKEIEKKEKIILKNINWDLIKKSILMILYQ